jgi:hypothetical protein
MQENGSPKITILALKMSLLIVASSFLVTIPTFYFFRMSSTSLGISESVIAAVLSGGNTISWAMISLGLLMPNRSKILYFLLGTSFKTLVILLVVHQLKTGPTGYLYLQVFTLIGSLFLLLLLASIFNRWLLKS